MHKQKIPIKKKKMEQFCSYCSVMFGCESDLKAHCNSEAHQLTIMSDEGREWRFRAPPRGDTPDQYSLCASYSRIGKCRLRNQCCEAHGEEELAEWKERYEYRQLKLQRAKECSLQGRHYTEELLEKWMTATNPNLILAETLDSVNLVVEPQMSLTVSEKNCHREWIFRLDAKTSLRHIALLYETHRNHFKIFHLRSGGSSDLKDFNLGPNCQEWDAGDNNLSDNSYTVKVAFDTNIYGTFRQDIVFDFGIEPVLVKKLCVDVVSESDMEKLQQARDTVISFTERWSTDDVTVVPFENKPYAMGELENHLLSFYPAPTGGKFTLTQSVMEPTLTEKNYCVRQHELLNIEEMAQYDLLSRYNVKAILNLTSCYLLTPNSAVTAKYAHNGELFANMKLSSILSEDSASGRLVLTNCNTVLLAPLYTKGKEQRKVYEAVIEDKGKTMIYIRLSKQCTEELNLKSDREFQAEVQFQLNRLPLCEMHFAVDRLHPPSMIFPDVSVQPKIWNNKMKLNVSFEAELNPKQKEAVLAITTPLSQWLPPVLIIGPFGTGKTYTLAQAVKAILREPNTRVLVCTHSNSAADIYIREYLYPSVMEGRTECTPLRIYFRHRWVATVHPIVQQYCLVKYEGSTQKFVMPTIEDVKSRRVIVTTLSTSRYLVQLGLEKGFFTHILIDEAAQTMECEAIMPLSLANENTRIVLAGDHMQLSPEIYSAFAQQRNLHTSLLERLYDLYPEDYSCKVLLCENYRSHAAIVRYTSELFYDNHLKAGGDQPPHPKYHPLTFFTAKGEDMQDVNSTAFHNYAEVFEIVERVIELKNNWPKNWGSQDESSIGVVTPYYDQVVRIRAELRKKKLSGVSVERVLNVQGKQFRVIFLSAVRTRQTCGNKSKNESDLDHGFLSNAKLLNTAITRAQSLVAVVGDPVSLCSVGKCRKLWEKFIHSCHEENSLFGITWDSLRSQLDSVELKKNYVLNPLAKEFIPGQRWCMGEPGGTMEGMYHMHAPQQQPQTPAQLASMFLNFVQGRPFVQPMMPPPPAPPPPQPYCFMPPPFQNFPQQPRPALNSNAGPPQPPPPHQRLPPFAGAGGPKTEPASEPGTGGGRILPKRSDGLSIGKDPVEAEEIRRMIGLFSRMPEHPDGGNKEERFVYQNGPYFGEKMVPKQPDMPNGPLRNGMVNNHEMGFIPDCIQQQQQMRKNKNHVSQDFWGMSPKHSEPKPAYPDWEGQNILNVHEQMRNPFGESKRGPPRDKMMFEGNPPHPMFMSPSMENRNMIEAQHNNADVPQPNLPVVQTSLIEKLTLLQKLLPAGTDIPSFLDNEMQTKSFLQLLYATEGSNSAKAFVFLLMAIKKDQQLLQEVHMNAQKRFPNACQFSPPQNVLDMSSNETGEITATFNSPRPVFGNHHLQDNFNMEQQHRIQVPVSPFSMPHILGSDNPFGIDQNRQEFYKQQSQPEWLHQPENMILNRPMHEPPSLDLSKLNIGNSLDNRLANEHLHPDMRQLLAGPMMNRNQAEFERPDENIRHLWNNREYKPQLEQVGTPFQFSEPGRQGSYLSKLRNISNVVNGGNMGHGMPLGLPVMEERVAQRNADFPSLITPGPLSVSYPDIPDILSSHIIPGMNDASSKVIRKPTQPTAESSIANSFAYDFNSSPMRYAQMPSEGMTYAKILRSPQH